MQSLCRCSFRVPLPANETRPQSWCKSIHVRKVTFYDPECMPDELRKCSIRPSLPWHELNHRHHNVACMIDCDSKGRSKETVSLLVQQANKILIAEHQCTCSRYQLSSIAFMFIDTSSVDLEKSNQSWRKVRLEKRWLGDTSVLFLQFNYFFSRLWVVINLAGRVYANLHNHTGSTLRSKHRHSWHSNL